ncbi:MAG: hypothetical protein Q9217_001940 [Psora testacea]
MQLTRTPGQARQERLLERQRGAGTRLVKNLDIGLILPSQENAPLQPRRTGRRGPTPQHETLPPQKSPGWTPAPELHSQRSSRRTPATELVPQLSRRRIPAPDSLPPQRSSRLMPGTGASRKRARSFSENVVQDDGDDETRKASAKKRKLRGKPATIDEEPMTLPTTENDMRLKDLNQDDIAAQAPKKRKKRKSIGQQLSKRAKPKGTPDMQRQPSNANVKRGRPRKDKLATAVEDLHDNLDPTIRGQLQRESTELGTESQPQPTGQEPGIVPSVGPISGQTPRKANKRKRISIGQQSKKKAKPPTVIVKKESTGVERKLHEQEAAESAPLVEETEGAEPQLQSTHPQATTKQPKPRRKKRKSIGQQKSKRTSTSGNITQKPVPKSKEPPRCRRKAVGPQATEVPEAEPEDQTLINEKNRQPVRGRYASRTDGRKKGPSIAKAPQRRPEAPTANIKPPKPTASRRQPANSIPITVYRPPTPSLSATSDELDLAPSTAPASKTFNAVDVLAQITSERLEKLSQKLSVQPNASRTQKQTLEMYTQELEQRLRQLSQALDANDALKSKEKAATKEERLLKKQIKEVEDERKRVGDRMEELRKQQKEIELEGLLRRIAGVVKEGWEMEGRQVKIGEVISCI